MVDIRSCIPTTFRVKGSNCVTPICPDTGRIDLVFETDGGQQVRLALGSKQAVQLVKLLQEAQSPVPTAESVSGDCDWGGSGGATLDLSLAITGVADTDVANESQYAFLLSDIEARLTDEVRWLVACLGQFSSRTELISKEVPDSANFSKSVTSFLSLFAFQLAHAC